MGGCLPYELQIPVNESGPTHIIAFLVLSAFTRRAFQPRDESLQKRLAVNASK
jgi:hypothetical protein